MKRNVTKSLQFRDGIETGFILNALAVVIYCFLPEFYGVRHYFWESVT